MIAPRTLDYPIPIKSPIRVCLHLFNPALHKNTTRSEFRPIWSSLGLPLPGTGRASVVRVATSGLANTSVDSAAKVRELGRDLV